MLDCNVIGKTIDQCGRDQAREPTARGGGGGPLGDSGNEDDMGTLPNTVPCLSIFAGTHREAGWDPNSSCS